MPQLTIEDVAKLAGVSRSTVSRVLNNHPGVRPVVRDHILQVIREHGYVPQAAARNLANQHTKFIGVLFPSSSDLFFSNPFFSFTAQGIAQSCMQRGYFPMLSLSTSGMDANILISILRARHFDGIVLVSSEVDNPMLSVIVREQIPVVRFGRHPYLHNLNWVDIDNIEGAHKAVVHLLTLGHRRIASILGPLNETCSVDRRDGYKKALLEAGVAIDPELMREGDWSQMSGYTSMKYFLNLAQRPTAVFCCSDLMALGALRAIDEAGLSVPDDIALVGFDDLPGSSFTTPPLTTINQPNFEMGVRAANMLIDQIENQQQPPQHSILSTSLVIRQSCGAFATHTPDVPPDTITSPSIPVL